MNPEGGDLFGGDYNCHGGPPTLKSPPQSEYEEDKESFQERETD